MKKMKKDFQPIYQKEKAYELQLQQDLKTLRGKLEKIEGISRAAIIPAKDIIVDDKVRWKCKYPVCFGYNSSALCPPNTPPAEEVKRIVHSFQYAIIFQSDVPVENVTGEKMNILITPELTDANMRSNSDTDISGDTTHFWLINEAVGQAENWANSMGYRQAAA